MSPGTAKVIADVIGARMRDKGSLLANAEALTDVPLDVVRGLRAGEADALWRLSYARAVDLALYLDLVIEGLLTGHVIDLSRVKQHG